MQAYLQPEFFIISTVERRKEHEIFMNASSGILLCEVFESSDDEYRICNLNCEWQNNGAAMKKDNYIHLFLLWFATAASAATKWS